MKTIFLVLPRRISVRYTLSAGFLDYFKERKDIRLVVLTSITDPAFSREFASERVIIEAIPMRDGKENWLEKVLRQARNYLGGVGQDIATFEAKARMRGRLFWLGYRLFNLILRPFVFFRTWLRWLDYRVISSFADKQYELLFKKYNPGLVVIHSVQELTGVPVARVAARKGVSSLGVVLSWDNLTNKGEVYARCDKLVVWNDIMKNQAVKYHGYKPGDVFAQGTPQFDYYIRLGGRLESREDFFKRKGLDPNKKLIVYTTVPERIGGQAELESITAIQQGISAGRLVSTQILVRVYTKDDPSRYKPLTNLENLILDNPGKLLLNKRESYRQQDEAFFLDLAATMKYADVVVNLVSTTTIDAAIFQTPVVNTALGDKGYWYEISHYKAVVEAKGVRVSEDPERLIVQIKNYLKDRNLDLKGRERVREIVCGSLDGRSLWRLSRLVLNLV